MRHDKSVTFIHLHNHSAYSLLEGAIKIEDLVQLAVRHNMPALALTDTNNLFGALEFAEKASKAGVQPIIGAQITVLATEPDRDVRTTPGASPAKAPEQLVLLAQNETGYRNLLHIVSTPYLDRGTGDVAPVLLAALNGRTAGLICLTGGIKGPINTAVCTGQAEHATVIVEQLKTLFPNRLYIEIQRHNLADEQRCEDAVIDLAYTHDIPLVATNDIYFESEDMYDAHDALLCIADGRYVVEEERRRETPQHYFKSQDEMRLLFADLPEAIANTEIIARRCAFAPKKQQPILPPFPVTDNTSEEALLRQLSRDGLITRLAQVNIPPEDQAQYLARLDYELETIIQMGFAGYFLIVADFIGWAKQHNIPVGPGRGSGAGSVVAWALAITDLNPLQFGLLFERFLNPERVSMPDFDIDFCQARRDEVIDYVRARYGNLQVANIITFGKLQARAVLRDVGRVMQIPYPVVDRICKMVPNNPANPVTLQQAIDGDSSFTEQMRSDSAVDQLITTALKLEGLYRHASTHAAGVVIGDKPLLERIPLYKDPKSTGLVTQFNMKDVENAGLVKFDFLGLKTLTVLRYALDTLAARGIKIDLERLPFSDDKTFAMLSRGESSGVFQLESSGMRDTLRRLKPNRFEDIIALVSLYRPGPMDNIPKYIAVKDGEEEPDYLHPALEPILRETYGIMIYQEQVMQVAQTLSGYTLGAADLLRRAMGKKIKEEMDAQAADFVAGAANNNVPPAQAQMIFDQVAKFAGYGFNKSHAAAYALIAWQTAYLKANYPVEFMAALMTLDMDNTDKLAAFKGELSRIGVILLPPDINASQADFAVEQIADGALAIRYALGALKGVGHQAMLAVITERHDHGLFTDMADFARRAAHAGLNRRQWEALAAAGAFDSVGVSRAIAHAATEQFLRYGQRDADEKQSGQFSLFGGDATQALPPPPLPQVEDWPPLLRLQNEFAVLGFYLSAHPLDAYQKPLARLGVVHHSALEMHLLQSKSSRVKMAGIIIDVTVKTARSGNKFAFIKLSDTTGSYEVMAFSEILHANRDLLVDGQAVLVSVDAMQNEEGLRLSVQTIEPLDTATANMSDGIKITLSHTAALTALSSLLDDAKGGKADVRLELMLDDGRHIEMELPGKYRLGPAQQQLLQQHKHVAAVESL